MTRRLTLGILSTVAVSVLLAGIGTLALTRYEDRRATETELTNTATALTTIFTELPLGTSNETGAIRARLSRIQEELRIADAELLAITRQGQVLGELPDSLDDDTIDLERLREEGVISGTQGSIVYAAALGERPASEFVVILTSDSSRLTDPVFRWILLSTAVALAAGALVAWMLGRRFSRPVVAASDASRQIAAGNLAARVHTDHRQSNELRELGESINHMAASLDRARGLERQFLLSVSHDLRTPLTSIQGYAEAIADGTAPDDARAAEVIRNESRRLERLVTDLLDLAKLEARQFALEPQPIDLGEVVPDVAAGFEREAAEHGISIGVEGPHEPVMVSADPDRLAQVLANLLQNAMKFADDAVQVSWRLGANGAELVVADNGPGIATEDLPHVFERLYVAAQTPRRKETGSGLGLAIVRELVEAQDGTVTALPRPTGGTQFVVVLPTARPGSPAPGA